LIFISIFYLFAELLWSRLFICPKLLRNVEGKKKKRSEKNAKSLRGKKSELRVIGGWRSPWTFCGWWWDVKEIQTSASE